MPRASRFAILLVVLFSLAATTTRAQTPATTVKDVGGSVVFQSNADGGLLVPGTFGTGTIPAEGAGTRLMWDPARAAFRAGVVGQFQGGAQWDAEKVGDYSVAFGVDTKASGLATTAIGDRTTASGTEAMAMGNRTTASGRASTAMGDVTTASGLVATAMGNRTTASGAGATAMGSRTTASGLGATAMGQYGTAASNWSLTVGKCNSANTSADNSLFVVGNGSGGTFSCESKSDALVLDQSGNLTISGSLTENSDRRLKTAIDPLGEGVLRKLAELRPVHYQFKNQETHPSGEQIGLIAQDVRKEFPALVSKGSGGMLSLAYPKLTAVLVKGLQEQQAEIGRQQATIDSLKQKVRSLQTVKKRQARLAEQMAALQERTVDTRTGALPAGWGLSTLLALLLAGAGFGAGLFWRRTGA